MSNRNGLKEHFIATVKWTQNGESRVAQISAWEINSTDAKRIIKNKVKGLNGGSIPSGTITNLSNGRTLKIR